MTDADATNPLTDGDLVALAAVVRGNDWTRSVLCTLARRGVGLRQREPARAQALIDAVSTWPWFKAGQFLFDLMEWEDFMVDGEPPAVLPTVLDATALSRFANLLRQLQGLLDGVTGDSQMQHVHVDGGQAGGGPAGAEDLPELEQGMHLYRDVALGVFATVGPLLEDQQAGPPANAPNAGSPGSTGP